MNNPREYRFPEVLKALLGERNMSQNKFAFDTDFNQHQVNNWCLGRVMPSLSTLMFLSDYFEVSIDYLVYGDKNI